MNPILENLNKEQYEAVTHFEGPMLVMAGAGSGKTKVLTHRIAYLIEEKQISPFHILAITFTNKAAKEMKDRVIQLVGKVGKQMYISTFHSMCVHILRQDIYHLDYKDNFVIYDDKDQTTLIKKIMTNLNIDQKYYTPKRISNSISNLKNDYIFPRQYKETLSFDRYPDEYKRALSQIYENYQKELKEANALDFDDLIMLTIKLFEEEPAILDFYQKKFQFVMVDEYQDTNTSQFKLVEMLSRKHKNLFVVGDTDQSIYSWRGANIRNIQEFEKDFVNDENKVKTIFLEQNYRSYQNILDCANCVIKHNYPKDAHIKKLWSSKKDEEKKVTYYRAVNSDVEAEYIAEKINRMVREEGYSFNDFAILYRTNALSLNLEKTFKRYHIDYVFYGNVGFFDRKEVKDLVAYLRLVINPDDNVSFLRVVNEPRRGIGKTTLDAVMDYAFRHHLSFYQASIAIDTLSNRAKSSIMSFIELVNLLIDQLNEMDVNSFIDLVLNQTGYLAYLERDKDEESKSRVENVKEFKSLSLDLEESLTKDDVLAQRELTTYDKLGLILNTLTLSSEAKQDKDQAVKLMTVHAAKGLEFKVVFIYSVEENIFPLGGSEALDEDLEEERRLMYVAITRAEEELFITNSEIRKMYGDYRANPESRFIGEIDTRLLDRHGIQRKTYEPRERIRKAVTYDLPEQNNDNEKKARTGSKLKHAKFGEGVVVSISGDIATIAFAQPYGIKKLDINHPAITIL
jgi:DNA helicase II / ATP-dependent DNA helicase PcrA